MRFDLYEELLICKNYLVRTIQNQMNAEVFAFGKWSAPVCSSVYLDLNLFADHLVMEMSNVIQTNILWNFLRERMKYLLFVQHPDSYLHLIF